MADSLDSGSSVHYGRAGSSPASRTTSSRTMYRSRRLFFEKSSAHSHRRSYFPQKVTLGSPTQLQAPSRRFAVATNFLRVQIHHIIWHLFRYLLTRRSNVRFAPTYFYAYSIKIRHPSAPLLLRSESKLSEAVSIRFLRRAAAFCRSLRRLFY